MSKLIPSYEEQAARIKVLERAVILSDKDYERMKAAAQVAYRAMVAMELSDGSKREWDAAVSGLRAALAEPEQEYICKCGLRVVSHQCKTDKEF